MNWMTELFTNVEHCNSLKYLNDNFNARHFQIENLGLLRHNVQNNLRRITTYQNFLNLCLKNEYHKKINKIYSIDLKHLDPNEKHGYSILICEIEKDIFVRVFKKCEFVDFDKKIRVNHTGVITDLVLFLYNFSEKFKESPFEFNEVSKLKEKINDIDSDCHKKKNKRVIDFISKELEIFDITLLEKNSQLKYEVIEDNLKFILRIVPEYYRHSNIKISTNLHSELDEISNKLINEICGNNQIERMQQICKIFSKDNNKYSKIIEFIYSKREEIDAIIEKISEEKEEQKTILKNSVYYVLETLREKNESVEDTIIRLFHNYITSKELLNLNIYSINEDNKLIVEKKYLL